MRNLHVTLQMRILVAAPHKLAHELIPYRADLGTQTTSTLNLEHPAGVFRRQGTRLAKLLHIFLAQLDVQNRQIVLQLIDALRTKNDLRNKRSTEQSRQGDASKC